MKSPKKENKESPNLSDKELRDRLDNYSQIGDMENHYTVFQSLKQKYSKQTQETNEKRNIAEIYYAQGVRSGLPHAPIQTIRQTNERLDQDLRDSVIQEAKEYYEKNNSLSKTFDENHKNPTELRQAFKSAKDKGMDKG